MPAKKDSYWEDKVKSLRANNPLMGAGRITQALEQIAANAGREDAPKIRWVGGYLKKLNEDPKWPLEAREYHTFHWPQSMGGVDLPWESTDVLFELLQATGPDSGPYMESGPFKAGVPPYYLERPDVRLARWFWRVTQAMGPYPCRDMPPDDYLHVRIVLAHFLREWELGGRAEDELAGAVEAAIVQIRQETFNYPEDMHAFWRIFEPWILREEDKHGKERE